jgi:hypothetical protein
VVIPRPLYGRGISLCRGLSGLQGGIPRCARNDKRGYGITTMAALYQGTALAVPLRRGKIFFGAGSSARLKPGPDTMPAKNAARLRAGFFVARGFCAESAQPRGVSQTETSALPRFGVRRLAAAFPGQGLPCPAQSGSKLLHSKSALYQGTASAVPHAHAPPQQGL